MPMMNNNASKPIALLAILAIAFSAMGAAQPPAAPHAAPAKAREAPSPTHLASSHLVNPHLHGAMPVVAKKDISKKTAEKTGEGRRSIARHWYGHWSFAYWATLHRGTGTIEGEVRTASGSPVAGAHMVLRTSKGRTFRAWSKKHITTTSSGGFFMMRNVRIGSYRVRASKGKTAGATPTHVHGGSLSTVAVKI
jgi:hypothetical protein